MIKFENISFLCVYQHTDCPVVGIGNTIGIDINEDYIAYDTQSPRVPILSSGGHT